MTKHHEEHPEYGAMGIFAGYGEFDEDPASDCAHIGIVSISPTDCQCMDCLRIWPKQPGFVSDWPDQDRG